jgi:hypothetical protein
MNGSPTDGRTWHTGAITLLRALMVSALTVADPLGVG